MKLKKEQLKEILDMIFGKMSDDYEPFSDAELEILSKCPNSLDMLKEIIPQQQEILNHFNIVEEYINEIKLKTSSGIDFEDDLTVKLYSESYKKLLDEHEANTLDLLSYEQLKKPKFSDLYDSVTEEVRTIRSNQKNIQDWEKIDSNRKINNLSSNTSKLEEFKDSFRENGKKGGKKVVYDDYYKLVESLIKNTDEDPSKRGFKAQIYHKSIIEITRRSSKGELIGEPSKAQAERIIKSITKSICS